MSYSLKIVKNYADFLNEATASKKPNDRIKFIIRENFTEKQLTDISKEANAYFESVKKSLREDDAFKDMKGIKIILKKAAPMVGLSKEQADALNVQFKDDDDGLKFGTTPESFNQLYIEKKELKEILEDKEGAALKTEYDGLIAKITEWNKTNAKIFKFENNKGDKVNNPDESNTAIAALKTILDAHVKLLKNLSIELIGHTSSTGDTEKNQKLSEERATVVKNLLIAAIPEAKDWNVTSSGKGESELLYADDANDKEKQQGNRRVEVKISTEAPTVAAPQEKITYNCIVWGFFLIELTEEQVPIEVKRGGKIPKWKPTKFRLNPRKLIPCPNWGR